MWRLVIRNGKLILKTVQNGLLAMLKIRRIFNHGKD